MLRLFLVWGNQGNSKRNYKLKNNLNGCSVVSAGEVMTFPECFAMTNPFIYVCYIS